MNLRSSTSPPGYIGISSTTTKGSSSKIWPGNLNPTFTPEVNGISTAGFFGGSHFGEAIIVLITSPLRTGSDDPRGLGLLIVPSSSTVKLTVTHPSSFFDWASGGYFTLPITHSRKDVHFWPRKVG